jgi:hypothetical protein
MDIEINEVQEIIKNLESSGELSIKEEKYLGVAKLCVQLAAENSWMKAISDDRRMFIMNGVQLGYIKVPTVETDPALETIRIAVSPQEPTPATDRIVAGVKADGVESGIKTIMIMLNHQAPGVSDAINVLRAHSSKLREGADK